MYIQKDTPLFKKMLKESFIFIFLNHTLEFILSIIIIVLK